VAALVKRFLSSLQSEGILSLLTSTLAIVLGRSITWHTPLILRGEEFLHGAIFSRLIFPLRFSAKRWISKGLFVL
jgi:hypothetical protein